jgi:hypothetical protein
MIEKVGATAKFTVKVINAWLNWHILLIYLLYPKISKVEREKRS